MILYENIKLNRTQIFADPPATASSPVRHRLRLRRMPGRLGWRASLQWQAGLCPKKGNSYTMNLTIEENHGN
jgi:hypothetical protein